MKKEEEAAVLSNQPRPAGPRAKQQCPRMHSMWKRIQKSTGNWERGTMKQSRRVVPGQSWRHNQLWTRWRNSEQRTANWRIALTDWRKSLTCLRNCLSAMQVTFYMANNDSLIDLILTLLLISFRNKKFEATVRSGHGHALGRSRSETHS